jgi:hypothetical protein
MILPEKSNKGVKYNYLISFNKIIIESDGILLFIWGETE